MKCKARVKKKNVKIIQNFPENLGRMLKNKTKILRSENFKISRLLLNKILLLVRSKLKSV